jgi:hypothetical protein
VLSKFFRDLSFAGVWKNIDKTSLKINEGYKRAGSKTKKAMYDLLMNPAHTKERVKKVQAVKELMKKERQKPKLRLVDVKGRVGMGSKALKRKAG